MKKVCICLTCFYSEGMRSNQWQRDVWCENQKDEKLKTSHARPVFITLIYIYDWHFDLLHFLFYFKCIVNNERGQMCRKALKQFWTLCRGAYYWWCLKFLPLQLRIEIFKKKNHMRSFMHLYFYPFLPQKSAYTTRNSGKNNLLLICFVCCRHTQSEQTLPNFLFLSLWHSCISFAPWRLASVR